MSRAKAGISDMPEAALSTSLLRNGWERALVVLVLLPLLAALTFKGLALTELPVNQDEFNYLSQVYSYQRGEPTSVLQTFHVHFFGWLAKVSENEVLQVVAARKVMLGLFLGTVFFTFLLARHYLSIPGALFSASCYVALSFTLINGASFRADTPAAFLVILAIYLFVVKGEALEVNVVAGLALALACLFTIKSGIYLMLFPSLFCARWIYGKRRREFLRLTGGFVIAGALAFLLLYWLHASTFPLGAATGGASLIGVAYGAFITLREIFPSWEYFRLTLRWDSLIWALMAAGALLCCIEMFKRKDTQRPRTSHLVIYLIPLSSLLVYRNGFPYFYAFVTPCAMLLCGHFFDWMRTADILKRPYVSAPAAAILAALVWIGGAQHGWAYYQDGTALAASQRDFLSDIHRMFPAPVPYVDGCRIVSSYPNVSFFMSSAGLRGYERGEVPELKQAIESGKPIFLIADVPHLNLVLPVPGRSATGKRLRADDWTAMKAYFVHHYGYVWVAGKQFEFRPDRRREQFEMPAAGLYTIEGEAQVKIDGRLLSNGDVINIGPGRHIIAAAGPGLKVTLRWGNHLYRPKRATGWQDLFMGPLL